MATQQQLKRQVKKTQDGVTASAHQVLLAGLGVAALVEEQGKGLVDRLVAGGKEGEKLFDQLGPRYAKRNGGYLRILKTGFRKGDNAPLAVVTLLDQPETVAEAPAPEPKNKAEKKEASKAG